jgi:hypothetical protein
VVHQVGVRLGEVAEVVGDAVSVERVGLDEPGETIAPPRATPGAR